jgi:hypothetical protein
MKSIPELLSTAVARAAVSRELNIHRATVTRWTGKLKPVESTAKSIRALLETPEERPQIFAVHDRIEHRLLGKGRVTVVGEREKKGYYRCCFNSSKWGWILGSCLKKEEV